MKKKGIVERIGKRVEDSLHRTYTIWVIKLVGNTTLYTYNPESDDEANALAVTRDGDYVQFNSSDNNQTSDFRNNTI